MIRFRRVSGVCEHMLIKDALPSGLIRRRLPRVGLFVRQGLILQLLKISWIASRVRGPETMVKRHAVVATYQEQLYDRRCLQFVAGAKFVRDLFGPHDDFWRNACSSQQRHDHNLISS